MAEGSQPGFRFEYYSDRVERDLNKLLRDDVATRNKFNRRKRAAVDSVLEMKRPYVGEVDGIKYFRANQLRAFFVVDGSRIVILSAYLKKTDPVSGVELERAKRRKEELGL